MAARCAGLILENPSSVCPALFKKVSQLVQDLLYVPLAHEVHKDTESASAISQQLNTIYQISPQCTSQLDIRPVLPLPRGYKTESLPPLTSTLEAVLTTRIQSLEELQKNQNYHLLSTRYDGTKMLKVIHVDVEEDCVQKVPSVPAGKSPVKSYNAIAVGGTFDHFHDGHRLFLAQAVLMARERILVGIADGPLLANKILTELIEPVEKRVEFVRGFLRDMKPWLQIDVLPITDVFGPTATDGSLECLVITQDSVKGGDAVNKERIKRGLPVMAIECVEMVGVLGGLTESVASKLSSTTIRQMLLGDYLHPQVDRTIGDVSVSSEEPYVVGLTGGIASGKSSVAQRLAALGAHVVDCDKLGHRAYEPGTDAYLKIVETFGDSVIGENGQIDRKTLGGIVFSSKDKMKELTDIVWPEILKLAHQEIKAAWSQGYKVSILDAAILLEAEWDQHCHEVWVSVIPRSEALRRVIDRDCVSEESAIRKIDAQLTNKERVSHAHVLLSTLWEREETQRQVEKAWKLLNERLSLRLKSSL